MYRLTSLLTVLLLACLAGLVRGSEVTITGDATLDNRIHTIEGSPPTLKSKPQPPPTKSSDVLSTASPLSIPGGSSSPGDSKTRQSSESTLKHTDTVPRVGDVTQQRIDQNRNQHDLTEQPRTVSETYSATQTYKLSSSSSSAITLSTPVSGEILEPEIVATTKSPAESASRTLEFTLTNLVITVTVVVVVVVVCGYANFLYWKKRRRQLDFNISYVSRP